MRAGWKEGREIRGVKRGERYIKEEKGILKRGRKTKKILKKGVSWIDLHIPITNSTLYLPRKAIKNLATWSMKEPLL